MGLSEFKMETKRLNSDERNILDILLIPPLPNQQLKEQSDSFMPLGLLALHSNLSRHNFKSKIYRPIIRIFGKKDYKKVAEDILTYRTKAVGFSTWCVSYATSLLIAREIKRQDSKIIIIFGGPQASILDLKTLEYFSYVDYVLCGEADNSINTFLELILKKKDNRKLKEVPGLAYRDKDSKIKKSAVSCITPNLDELPIPAYELSETRKINIDIGRGCPFKCTYCSTSGFFSKKYRVKSVNRVIKELEYCYEKTGNTYFGFSHDMFTSNRAYVFSLCNALIDYYHRKNIGFTWTCSARPDCVSDELISIMKKAGCVGIFFGIESGSKKIQRQIKKNLNLQHVDTIAKSCSKHGIRMTSSFMAGFPAETEYDIDQTIYLILKLIGNGSRPQMSLLSVLPGTEIYNKFHTSLKFDGRFSDFSGYYPTLEEIRMIKKYPDIFSSFFYLPIEGISRNYLYSLSRLVNNVREFRHTAKFLATFIIRDLNNNPIFKSVMDQLFIYTEKYRRNAILLFILDLIGMYYPSISQDLLPKYFRDLFITETAQTVVIRKFFKQQLKRSQVSPDKVSKSVSIDDKIKIHPYWTVIKTSFCVPMIIEQLDNYNQNIQVKKGNYNYLVIARSEKKAEHIRLANSQVFVLKKLKNGKISKLLKSELKGLNEKEILSLVRRFGKLGVLTIKTAK